MALLGWFSEDEYDVFHVCVNCQYWRFNRDTFKVLTQDQIRIEHPDLDLCEKCYNKINKHWIYGPCYQTASESEVKNSITQRG